MYICIYVCIYIYVYIYVYAVYDRRKFRGQTSDNMDRWKSRSGKSQAREEKKEEDQGRERVSKKTEDAGVRKGSKVAKHCVSPMVRRSRGSKSRLAKAAGAEPCGQMRDEKLHAVVARSTFPSQNAQNTLLEAVMSLEGSDVILHGRRKRFCTLPKVSKREDFVAFPKTMAGVGHLQRICEDAFRVAGAGQETSSSEMLGGRGADFLSGLHFGPSDLQFWEDDFAWQVQHFVWPGTVFGGKRSTLGRWIEKIAQGIGTRPSAHSALNFQFLKEVSQNCFVFNVVIFKIEEVSQNCFVFGAIKFRYWGSLAE